MTRILATILAAAMLCSGWSFAQEKKQEKKADDKPAVEKKDADAPKPALCPVTNKPIDKKVSTKFRSKRVYFADADAMKKFEADPTKYSDGVKAQWDVLKPLRVQVNCPVTGKPIDRKFASAFNDDDVYFATAEAKAAWDKDSKPYASKLESDCYTFQTNCLICGMEIDPAISVDVDGRKIYVGCNGCPEKIKSDKTAYAKKYDDAVAANKAAYAKRQAADAKR